MTVTTVSSRFTANALPDGRLLPNDLPCIADTETIRIAYALKPMLGGSTVSSVSWSCDPSGPSLSNSARSNSNQNVETDITGDAGLYKLIATCTLADGSVRAPFAYVRITGSETEDYE